MMATGFAAVVVVTLVALANGGVTVGDSNWWEGCTGQVCTVAEKQAEGLARLRVLSNYVKETMSLMTSVVSSLDDEMLAVGQELRSVVGRRCHARGPSALTALIAHMNHTEAHGNEEGFVEVISDDSDDSWASNSDLTQGSTTTWSSNVDVLMGSSPSISHSTSHRPSSTSQRPSSTSHSTYHGISQGPSRETDSTSQSISHHPSSTSHRTSQHPSRVSQISTTTTTTSTASHTTGKTLHRRPSSTLKKYEGQPSAPSESVYVAPVQPEEDSIRRGGGGGQGHKQGVGRGQGRGKGNARGRGQEGARGHGRGRGQQAALGSLGSDTFESCRGVPIGSPYYVPGLDSWCANNCPRMCPATHCICSTP